MFGRGQKIYGNSAKKADGRTIRETDDDMFLSRFQKSFGILLREAEKSKLDDEVTDRLGALRKEGAKTKRWIKDFLNGFSLPQFQSLVREYVEKLDKIDGKDFDFSKAK